MRVLVVEDEPLIAQRLERFCREILGEKLTSVRVDALYSEASARLARQVNDSESAWTRRSVSR